MKNDEFAISFEGNTSERAAYRVNLPGLTAKLSTGETFPVHDLSSTGLSIQCTLGLTASSKALFIDLYVSGRLYLATIKAQLVRGGVSGLTAFSFIELDTQQEYRLDKLVLARQKQMIEMRKARGKEE